MLCGTNKQERELHVEMFADIVNLGFDPSMPTDAIWVQL